MAKRRSNHEGTIFKRKNGKWRAQISIDGHRMSFTGNTQRECQEWVRDMRNRIVAGYSFSASKRPLKDFLTNWLVSIKSSRQSNTWHQYQRVIEVHVLPTLGEKTLGELRPEHIQNLYDDMLSKRIGRRTVQLVHTTLHVALDQGVRLGLLLSNPTDATNPPKRKQREMHIYDQEQSRKLIETAEESGDRNLALYLLAITTGMRQAELLGLKWKDIDWERKSLKIRRQLRRVIGRGFTFDQPKTKAGRRTVIIGQDVVDRLKEHRETQQVDKMKAGARWQEFGLVFPSKIGTPMDVGNLRREYRKLIELADLPTIRFHDLRHTAASLMLNYGVPVIVVSRRLGHSQPSITLDVYGHLIPSMQDEAARLMDDLMAGRSLVAP